MQIRDFITERYDSPLGEMIIACDGSAITGLWFADQRYLPEGIPGAVGGHNAAISDCVRWLDLYFSGKVPDFIPKLNLSGTDFRKRVWQSLLTIRYGTTTTYGRIAGEMASVRGVAKMSARAVGGAVGHNPIGIIVPCHRVIGADGRLTGYAGGLDRKMALLDLEGIEYKL